MPVSTPLGLPDTMWVDGRPADEVSLLDRGLHYGDGLFETIACVGGGARFLSRHLKRLSSGCVRLAVPEPDSDELTREIGAAAAGSSRAVVKLILTRGRARVRGYGFSGEDSPTRIMLRYPWKGVDEREVREGVRVRLADLRLGENPKLAGLKHLNRLEQVLARNEWSDDSIAEALLFSSSGALISGTMTNVFLVHEGKLATPRLDRCGVAGVMREVVGELSARCGIDFNERPLDRTDLEAAQEIFLTNALTGIRPVRELAGRTVGLGPVTRQLQQALAPLISQPGESAGG
jgi:4-amino-4-deoxychorismate lyase